MENKNEMLDTVLAIENQELKRLVDEKEYLEKIRLLCLLAGGDVDRVWGEYNLVQNITSQPVLMNKAMSIPLTKNEVALLIDDLSKKYATELRVNNISKINLVFSTTLRGHAKQISKEIVLPKLGDWRFGYKEIYSAELIFHEFSHLLDYGRIKRQSYGKSDIHKHDFVRILDRMLEKYKEFIESKYLPIRQREQILNNSKLLTDFHVNQEQIIAEDIKKEEDLLLKKKEEEESKYSELGLSENSFPIHALMNEDKELKLKYIQFLLDNYESSALISLQLKENISSLKKQLEDDKPILNKVQIDLLVNALDKSKVNDFLLKLPLMQQIKSGSILRKFNEEIRDMSKGKMSSIESSDGYKVRSYQDAEMLKKRGFED